VSPKGTASRCGETVTVEAFQAVTPERFLIEVHVYKETSDMLYQHTKYNGAGATITGNALAYGNATTSERAFVGARLVLGQMHLIDPCITQASAVVRVCRPSIEAAVAVLKNSPDLEARVLSGKFSLIAAGVLAKHSCPLVERFLSATSSELAELGKYAGIDTVWDLMIAPNIPAHGSSRGRGLPG
jgi:hypothetical protein